MSASLQCRFSPHTTTLRVYQQAPVSLRRCSCRQAPAHGTFITGADTRAVCGLHHQLPVVTGRLNFCGGLEGVQIAGVRPGVGDAFLGKRLGDVARAARHADLESRAAFEAVFDFYVSNQGDIGIITHYGNEPTVERFFRRRCMAVCTGGPMSGPGQKPHPRAPGAFPRAPRMARGMRIPLEEVVYRMSVLPQATRLPGP
jgi:hypothetical protein